MRISLSFALVVVLLLSSAPALVYQPVLAKTEIVSQETPKPPQKPKTAILATTTLSADQLTIKAQVEAAFPDVPLMSKVIFCESGFRQFSSGVPLVSPTADVGVMQINQSHWKDAKNRGLDIFNSVKDNIIMGRIVYDSEGITAWMALGNTKCMKSV